MIEISHQQARFLIRQGLDSRRLPDEQWASLQLHLDSCAGCRQYREHLSGIERSLSRSLRSRLDSTPRASSPVMPKEVADLQARQRRRRKRRLKAVAFGGFAVLGLLMLALMRPVLGIDGSELSPTVAETRPRPVLIPTPSSFSFRGLLAFAGPVAASGDIPSNSEIFIFNPGTGPGKGSLENLTRSPAEDNSPVWSPDGEWLAFLSNRVVSEASPPKYEVYVINVSGSRLTRLTDHPDVEWSGPLTWSSDGSWIALTGLQAQGDTYIYLVPTNSQIMGQKGARPLGMTRGAPGPALFSPNSQKVAFGSYEQPLQGLLVYDLATGRFSAPTTLDTTEQALKAGSAGEFDWTYAGESLIYLAEGPFDSTGPGKEAESSLRITYPMNTYAIGLSNNRRNPVLEIINGSARIRGLTAVPGELERSVVYLLDENEAGCWTIHLREDRLGFFETTSVPELCVAGRLSRNSWRQDPSGSGAPWLVVAARRSAETGLGIYAVRLPGSPNEIEMLVERLADLPIEPYPNLIETILQVRAQSWRRMSILPAQASLYEPELAPVTPLPDTPGRLAFSHLQEDGSQVALIAPDGSNLVDIDSAGLKAQCPAWSPDGSQAALLSDIRSVYPETNDLYLAGTQNRSIQRMTFPDPDIPGSAGRDSPAYYECPVWSPDGARIALIFHTAQADYLALVQAGGGEVNYLRINPVVRSAGLAWSPDSSLLAFATRLENNSVNILVLEVETLSSGTANLSSLVKSGGWDDLYGLAFTTDGLVYLSSTSRSTFGNQFYLNWIALDGSIPRERVQLPSSTLTYTLGRGHLRSLPGGQLSILVHGRLDDEVKTRVVLYDPREGQVETLARLNELVFDAAWSPDGAWLSFTAETGLYVLNRAVSLAGTASPLKIYDGRAYQVDWR